jgi:geranylgeranyl pyrophosphate synthase
LKEIQHVFRSTGALDYVTSLMHEYAEKAKELISQSILSDRYKKVLFEFCDYLTGRAY